MQKFSNSHEWNMSFGVSLKPYRKPSFHDQFQCLMFVHRSQFTVSTWYCALLIHQMYHTFSNILNFLIGLVWFDGFDLLQIHIHQNVTRCQTGIRLNQIKRICNSHWNKNSQLKLIRFFISECIQNRRSDRLLLSLLTPKFYWSRRCVSYIPDLDIS